MSETWAKVEAEKANQSEPRKLRLALASPTYGPVDSRHAKYLRVAVMNAAANGVTWVADVSPDRMGWNAARDTAAKAALEAEVDGLVWCDSDMIIPANGITRLVSYDKDFVSGVYFQRIAPHFPLVAVFDKSQDSFRWMTKWPRDVFFAADGVGFGFCYTSTRLLKRMYDEIPEVKQYGWFSHTGKFSEDLGFSHRAVSIGCPPYVDTGLLLGHLGDAQEVTIDTFKAVNKYSEGTGDPLPVVETV